MYNTVQSHRAAMTMTMKFTYLFLSFNGFRFALLYITHYCIILLLHWGWDSRTGPFLAPNLPSVTMSWRRCIYKPPRVQVKAKQSITGKENNCKCTIDAADFPQKSYIFFFFSFWNWQLTKSTTCGKSFITLGPNQTINNGLLCQSCSGVSGTIYYYKNKKLGFWGDTKLLLDIRYKLA